MIETDLFPAPSISSFLTTRHITVEEAVRSPQLNPFHCVQMQQTHSDEIAILKTTPSFSDPIPTVDALITQEKGTALFVRTADCLPILIAHPNSGTIAGIHAGRVGTEKQILRKTLDLFRNFSDLKPGKTHIWFGPHICKSCYEINRDTHEHYDLTTENKKQVESVLSPQDFHLYEDPRCTKCCNNTFYSYRAEGQKSGRFYSIISLNVL